MADQRCPRCKGELKVRKTVLAELAVVENGRARDQPVNGPDLLYCPACEALGVSPGDVSHVLVGRR